LRGEGKILKINTWSDLLSISSGHSINKKHIREKALGHAARVRSCNQTFHKEENGIPKKVGRTHCRLWIRFAEYGTLSKIVKAEGIVQSVWRKEFNRFTWRNSE
jgi:hypothetical protein